AVQTARQTGDATYLTESLVLFGQALARQGEVEQARAALLEAQQLIDRSSNAAMRGFQRKITTTLVGLGQPQAAPPPPPPPPAPATASREEEEKKKAPRPPRPRPQSLAVVQGGAGRREQIVPQLERQAAAGMMGLLCVVGPRDLHLLPLAAEVAGRG